MDIIIYSGENVIHSTRKQITSIIEKDASTGEENIIFGKPHMGGRKKGCKNTGFHYQVDRMRSEIELQSTRYFRTYEELKPYYNISKSTLWRLCKGGSSRRFKWIKFSKVNISEERGNFLNDQR
tara:strand:- start:430 stop:801 length:372 start_codon:yes stop_codon:yes gene_type:complete